MTKTETSNNKTETTEQSTLYYFYSVGCGWCKKTEPLVDQLIADGYDILKLDLADTENQEINKELKTKFKTQCGTPWLVDAESGNSICGFREKDIIEKWANGEEIPTPPKPTRPVPKIPFMNATDSEIEKWEDDYKKWLEENDHLPENQRKSADELLSMPRPKSEPPKPPSPSFTDEQWDEWSKGYDKWKDDNSHLPNLQPASVIRDRFKQPMNQNQPVMNSNMNPDFEARVRRVEQKLDKLMKHLGVQ